MPIETGLEYTKNRLDNGCKIKFRALISANWNDNDLRYAEKIGCKAFRKPFDIEELLKWLENVINVMDNSNAKSLQLSR